jgi:hypothetical protein
MMFGAGAMAIALTVAAATVMAQGAPAAGGQGGGQGRPGGGGGRGPAGPPMAMTTTAFEDGAVIPAKFVGGMGVSPELKWTNAPMGTQSFVLLMHDPDVALQRNSLDVTHWLVWNIPGTATGLPEGVMPAAEAADGMRQVSLRAMGYMGPGAPANGPYHHYTFEVFALDTKLDVPAAAAATEAAMKREAVMAAMQGHILGKAVVMGRFHQ